ncbi:MAG TPA: GTP cyclohydrolase II [Polyangia bacterium]|nr:GTP cyclohydrolase II [Polyangia bacterium]
MLTRYAESEIPTRLGRFRVVVYRDCTDDSEHVALVRGDVEGCERVLCRVHSECWTSEVLGSLKCDCREQLERALDAIAQAGRGVVIYLRQEGRGIGLGNKIRAYALQEAGRDTVEANVELGFAPDLRRYDFAARMLADLGVRSVALMTNNPEKIKGLEAAGVKVSERVAHWSPPNEHNAEYLEVKKEKMGHLPEVLDMMRMRAWQKR